MLELTLVLWALAITVFLVVAKLLLHQIVLLIKLQQLPGPPVTNLLLGNIGVLYDTPGESQFPPVTNLPSENIFKVVRRWGRDYYPIYKNWIAYTGAANVMDPCDFEVSTICIRSHPNKFVDCFEQHEAHRKGDDLRDDAPMARYRLVDQYW
jgi:hypothetical protein